MSPAPRPSLMPRLDYPAAPTADQVDDYHGERVADPYRPLEDSDAPATRAWIDAQNALTERVLGEVPARAEIRARLAELWDYPRAGAPWRRGERWFQLRNTGLQDQDVLWAADAPDATGSSAPRPERAERRRHHRRVGYGGLRERRARRLRPQRRRLRLADLGAFAAWRPARTCRIGSPWSKFASAAWTHDDAGFFYGRYPEPPADAAYDAPNRDMELRYHRLGTDAADDALVFATPDQPEWGFEPEVTDDGRLLVISVWRGTDPENRVYVADLADGVEAASVRPLLDEADARYEPIAGVDGTLYLLTDRDAPLGRVMAIDVADPGELREVIPEGSDAIETRAAGRRSAGGRLPPRRPPSARDLRDSMAATSPTSTLPGIGTIGELAGRRDDAELFLTFMTFAAPAVVLAVAMARRRRARGPAAGAAVGPGRLRHRAGLRDLRRRDPDSRCSSRRRRDVVPSGDVPTLLYGYGGFQISVGPIFKPEWLAWMERGGLLAVASLRGGGEYGKAMARRRAPREQAERVRRLRGLPRAGSRRPAGRAPERIGISGRSNGGLLVGATITQHPELFGAVVAEVGVMDMLRFHRFTIGWGWTSDYGSADDPEQFRTLLAYSPLHNIRAGVAYPPTLVTTGDHDDRVVPGPLVQVRRRAAGGPGGRRARRHPHRHRCGPRHGQAGRASSSTSAPTCSRSSSSRSGGVRPSLRLELRLTIPS